ncbi:hypothetical protein ECEC4402_5135, partial [Escherichia coli EC4402]
MFLISVTS